VLLLRRKEIISASTTMPSALTSEVMPLLGTKKDEDAKETKDSGQCHNASQDAPADPKQGEDAKSDQAKLAETKHTKRSKPIKQSQSSKK